MSCLVQTRLTVCLLHGIDAAVKPSGETSNTSGYL